MHHRHRLDHVLSLLTLPGFVRNRAASRPQQKHMDATCKPRPAMSIANPRQARRVYSQVVDSDAITKHNLVDYQPLLIYY